VAATSGPGTAGAEGLVHEHGLDGAEATRPAPREAMPNVPSSASSAHAARSKPRFAEGAHGVDVEAVGREAGDHLLEGLLVVGEGEVHG